MAASASGTAGAPSSTGAPSASSPASPASAPSASAVPWYILQSSSGARVWTARALATDSKSVSIYLDTCADSSTAASSAPTPALASDSKAAATASSPTAPATSKPALLPTDNQLWSYDPVTLHLICKAFPVALQALSICRYLITCRLASLPCVCVAAIRTIP
jgi:hypothetical protein